MEALGATASSADTWSWDQVAPSFFIPSKNCSCTPSMCRHHMGIRCGDAGGGDKAWSLPLQSRPAEVTDVGPGALLGKQ